MGFKINLFSVCIVGIITILLSIFFFRVKELSYVREKLPKKIISAERIYSALGKDSQRYIKEIDEASDYSFLDKDLDNKKILLLGEQQHGDGATFRIKGKILQHLHKKGFDVIFFESSFFETAKLWQELKLGKKKKYNFTKALYDFWGNSLETEPIRNFFINEAKTANPLEIAGIDYQISDSFSQAPIAKELKAYLKKYPTYRIENSKNFWKSLENNSGPILLFNTPHQTIINKDSCMTEVEDLYNLVSQQTKKTRLDLIYERYLYNIYHFYYARITYKNSIEDQHRYRDSIMFENVKWQINHLYKNKKIAIWTANFHAAYDSDSAPPANLGGYLKKYFGDQVYSILFTSNEGKTTNISTHQAILLNQYLPFGFETLLSNKNHHLTYVRCPTDEAKKNFEFTMRFFGHNNIKNKWFRMMDSFIFIGKMYPATLSN